MRILQDRRDIHADPTRQKRYAGSQGTPDAADTLIAEGCLGTEEISGCMGAMG